MLQSFRKNYKNTFETFPNPGSKTLRVLELFGVFNKLLQIQY